jgi:leucyl aminopeptidase
MCYFNTFTGGHMKKKTLGTQFLEKFKDLRERDPLTFTVKITEWLRKHKIHYAFGQHEENGLLSEFFGPRATVLHILHANDPNTVLIGKGVTYDTGGYNLKLRHMGDMFYDRMGALLAIAAAIDNKVNAAVFFAYNGLNDRVVEGDILTEKRSKLRILIDNTDAEGRIGLAYLLAIAEERQVTNIITIATLTGSASVFSGDRNFALVHSKHAKKVIDGFNNHGLKIWPAPSLEVYDKAIDSPIKGSDIRSCGKLDGGGSMTAYSFLKRFYTGNLIHIDMAAMSQDKYGNGLVWGLEEVKYLLENTHG